MEQSVKKSFFGTDIPEGYNLIVEISETDKDFDLAKNIDITVYYNIFEKSYFRNMETLIEREKIEEVNEPIINNDYFKFLNIELTRIAANKNVRIILFRIILQIVPNFTPRIIAGPNNIESS